MPLSPYLRESIFDTSVSSRVSLEIFDTSVSFRVRLDILRCLVKDLGADVNGVCSEDGATALTIAAQMGNLPVLQCLVKELGADVNEITVEGTATPLSIAA
jgi:ankyrin repeat protein